jgi:hypothetical protein
MKSEEDFRVQTLPQPSPASSPHGATRLATPELFNEMLESVKNRDGEREKFLFDYEFTQRFKGQRTRAP